MPLSLSTVSPPCRPGDVSSSASSSTSPTCSVRRPGAGDDNEVRSRGKSDAGSSGRASTTSADDSKRSTATGGHPSNSVFGLGDSMGSCPDHDHQKGFPTAGVGLTIDVALEPGLGYPCPVPQSSRKLSPATTDAAAATGSHSPASSPTATASTEVSSSPCNSTAPTGAVGQTLGQQMTLPLTSVQATTGSTSGHLHLQQEEDRSGGDKALTQAKLVDLRRDIQQLDAAIRQNESARKDLVDWLFDQMGAEETRPSSSSSTTAGAKSVFDEKMNTFSRQCKSLYSRLEDTRYVVSQLELHDLPFDVDPKVYVQELLLRRRGGGKPRAEGGGTANHPQPAPVSRTDPLESSPAQLRLIDQPHQQEASSQSYSNLSHLRSSRTLPMPLRARTETGLIVARKTRTLPSGGFSDGGAQLPTTTAVVSPLIRKNSDPSCFVIPSSEEGRAVSVGRPQPSPYKSSSLGGEGERRRRMAEQMPSEDRPVAHNPTSPDLPLLTHHRHQQEEDEERGADPVDLLQVPVSKKDLLMLPPSGTKGDQLSSNVLSSILHGMENFGRRLPWTFKRRSVSEEDLNPESHDKSPADRLLRPLRFPTLTSMKKPRQVKQKNSSLSSHEPSHTQQPAPSSTALVDTNTRLPSSDSTGQQSIRRGASYSISNSSTNGLLPPGLPAPPDDEGVRNWLTGEDPSAAAAGSNSGGDQVLSRIFETLADASAATQTQSRTGGGVGSSGSSLSVIGAPTTSLPSNGRSMEAQQQQLQQHQSLTISSPLAPAAAVGHAFSLYHRHQEGKMAAVARHNAEYFRLLHEELTTLKSQNTELHNSLNNVTAQLESIRRDVTTSEELHQQHLSNAATRIEQLDANAEKSKQEMHYELFELTTEITSKLESLEYQLTTKTRDLDDNITSLSNKVCILEKPTDGHSLTAAQGSELPQYFQRVQHYLIALVLLGLAVSTMLFELLIRFFSLGAVITENRYRAVLVTVLFYLFLVWFFSEPLLIWLQQSPTGPVVSPQLSPDLVISGLDVVANQLTPGGSGNSTTGSLWRDALISFLRFLHRLNVR